MFDKSIKHKILRNLNIFFSQSTAIIRMYNMCSAHHVIWIIFVFFTMFAKYEKCICNCSNTAWQNKSKTARNTREQMLKAWH